MLRLTNVTFDQFAVQHYTERVHKPHFRSLYAMTLQTLQPTRTRQTPFLTTSRDDDAPQAAVAAAVVATTKATAEAALAAVAAAEVAVVAVVAVVIRRLRECCTHSLRCAAALDTRTTPTQTRTHTRYHRPCR
jgi:hypothetical protein